MNAKHKKRIWTTAIILSLLGIACGLILFALKKNINLFYTPTELLSAEITKDQVIRIGGYVKDQSVQFDKKNQIIHFVITDRSKEIKIEFSGILPNLFREGQTVIVTGQLDQTLFKASSVLAKHDEKYMPKSIATELQKVNKHVT